ncbi:protein RD3-like [Latimeria chalumnae]|uniref:RD3 like n=1 Tax=Latimeria chalumnae TaxID=7897 RepID=H3A9G0_LATCH|nr:PREDICTED: protein RD3-like [Latimeria chalumnae]XP_006003387.1 PREDICTED: protein RD3-like [Latimeria chalumnae]|eukprot:XP_006003386.1 PREDICTED: protein RD3-like [Latimeria chalumnae]
MPLFGWMKWVKSDSYKPPQNSDSEAVTRTLMRELTWHMKERERLVQETENEQKLLHTGVDYIWLRSRESLKPPIAATERRKLEILCSQVQPCHTGTVLCRLREVLAENDALPWEVVYIFKRILKDFLAKTEEEKQQMKLMDTWTTKCTLKFKLPGAGLNNNESSKDEIPTISSYVDKSMQNMFPSFTERIWNLPYY